MILDLNGITMNDDNPDLNGAKWWLTDWDGWDTPPHRFSTLPLTTRHGAIVTENLYDARAVTLTGVCVAPDLDSFWQSWYRLVTKTNLMSTTGLLKVTEDSITKRLSVSLASKLRMKESGVGAFTFEIPLTAPDPFKYNEEPTTVVLAAGDNTIVNNGNMPSPPIFTVTTGGSPIVLADTSLGSGWVLTFSALTAGTIIDVASRTVMNGVVSYYSNLQLGSLWWELQPGANVVNYTAGGSAVTMTYRDAWA